MSTPEDVIKQWKSFPQREVMLKICNSITENNDLISQILRTHLWAESLINGILYQVSKYSKKESFARKQKRLFELRLIDEQHSQELKILNDVRNLIAHNLTPNEEILSAVKKLPTYDQVQTHPELESLGLGVVEMGKFGLTTFVLLHYLMTIFWDPKIKI